MGGDHAPIEVIKGACLAVEKGYLSAEQIVLVGVRDELEEKISDPIATGFGITDAPDRLQKGESPIEAMRRRPKSSIAVGVGLLKSGEADAFVSAGNTGLVVASATLSLPRLEGIRRPGIAVTLTTDNGPTVIMDVGANPHAKSRHLQSYALMGSAYYHDLYGKKIPRVGMLNIGAEDEKGNPVVREAADLLRSTRGNYEFVGNVEGVDIFDGACDVVVCDGFTGNVLLKSCEGVAEYMLRSMARLMNEHGASPELRKNVIGAMSRDVDYSEYGGALLLGVEGIVTICHGRSLGPAICNAIRFSAKAVGANVNAHIAKAASAASETS